MAGESFSFGGLQTLYLGQNTVIPCYASKLDGNGSTVPYTGPAINTTIITPGGPGLWYGAAGSQQNFGQSCTQGPCVSVGANYFDFDSNGVAQINLIANGLTHDYRFPYTNGINASGGETPYQSTPPNIPDTDIGATLELVLCGAGTPPAPVSGVNTQQSIVTVAETWLFLPPYWASPTITSNGVVYPSINAGSSYDFTIKANTNNVGTGGVIADVVLDGSVAAGGSNNVTITFPNGNKTDANGECVVRVNVASGSPGNRFYYCRVKVHCVPLAGCVDWNPSYSYSRDFYVWVP